MVLAMKEKSRDKTYESEGRELMAEAMRRREWIMKKYEGCHHQGMDGAPWEKEAQEVSRWFNEELKKLKQKYGV